MTPPAASEGQGASKPKSVLLCYLLLNAFELNATQTFLTK
jgi:hypothetical protein